MSEYQDMLLFFSQHLKQLERKLDEKPYPKLPEFKNLPVFEDPYFSTAEDLKAGDDFRAVGLRYNIGYNIGINSPNSQHDLTRRMMMAIDQYIFKPIHTLTMFGDKNHNGLLNDPNVPNVRLENQDYDADSRNTTTQDHINFVVHNIIRVGENSNLVELSDTILVPTKLYYIWASAIINGTSVLTHLLENSSLKRILTVKELQSEYLEEHGVHSVGTNKDRVVFFSFNRKAVESKFSPIKITEPQRHMIYYIAYAYCGTPETIWHDPSSGLYVDIPKL